MHRRREARRFRWSAMVAVAALAAVLAPREGTSLRPVAVDTTVTAPTTATAGAVPASLVTQPCGWRVTPPARYDHVVWIVLENHSYEDVVGAAGSSARAGAPYLNSLADRCGLATNYWAVTHPSLPNYLALTSGGTGGVTTSCTPASCPQRRNTIFNQVANHGRAWRLYAESMGSRCLRTDNYPYVVRHNPATYFPGLRDQCRVRDRSLGTLKAGWLAQDTSTDGSRRCRSWCPTSATTVMTAP